MHEREAHSSFVWLPAPPSYLRPIISCERGRIAHLGDRHIARAISVLTVFFFQTLLYPPHCTQVTAEIGREWIWKGEVRSHSQRRAPPIRRNICFINEQRRSHKTAIDVWTIVYRELYHYRDITLPGMSYKCLPVLHPSEVGIGFVSLIDAILGASI